jgi:hypothetical protein
MSCRSAGERRLAHLLSLQSTSAEDHEADRQGDQPGADRQAARLGDQADQRRTREKATVARAMPIPDASSGRRPAALNTMDATSASPSPCRRSRSLPPPDDRQAAPRRGSTGNPDFYRMPGSGLIRSGHDDWLERIRELPV